MANSLLTINMITRQAVRLFRNSNAITQTIKRSGLRIVKDPGTEVGSELEWVRLTFKQPTSWTRVSGYSQYRCDQTGEVFTFNWAKTA